MAIDGAPIAIVGAGRMGRGIALAHIFAGWTVVLVDLKPRHEDEITRLFADVREELRADLDFLARSGLMPAGEVEPALGRLQLAGAQGAAAALAGAEELVFEAAPETEEAKASALRFIGAHAAPSALIASTTSTMDADKLAGHVLHPERFMNAHWLNPAHLMPLVELSPCRSTTPAALERLKAHLVVLGKVPVVCRSSPGLIVPRIQALAMNEAARIVAEGVASADDVDRAVVFGFGLRFSILGLLEFVDWGGCDILDDASRFMAAHLDPARFAAPGVIREMTRTRRRGLRDGRGFYDYSGVDLTDYRQRRLGGLLEVLKQRDLAPRYGSAEARSPASSAPPGPQQAL